MEGGEPRQAESLSYGETPDLFGASAPEPKTTSELQPDGASVVAVEMPVKSIELDNKLLPQFKADANPVTGEVRGQELKASKYERPSNPVVVWLLNNGRRVLVTGRHRLALAKRLGEETIPATVVREADGFDRQRAMTLDAEFNIRDGNGTLDDYATYFENTAITAAEADARGLRDRAQGAAAWDLARAATDDLKALFRGGKIGAAHALAIARTAPGNAGEQQVGIRYALQGKSAEFISNVMNAIRAGAGQRGQTLDLFGHDDSAIREMETRAARATEEQNRLRQQISAVQGAARRPEIAKRLGVDVGDVGALQGKIEGLRAELLRWENWPMQPDLVAKVSGPKSAGGKAQSAASLREDKAGQVSSLSSAESGQQRQAESLSHDALSPEATAAVADTRARVDQAAGRADHGIEVYYDAGEIRTDPDTGRRFLVEAKYGADGRLKVNAAFAHGDRLGAVVREEWGHQALATPEGQRLLQKFMEAHPLTPELVGDLRAAGYFPEPGETPEAYRVRLHDEFVAKAGRNKLGWFEEMADRLRIAAKQLLGLDLTPEQAARALLRELRNLDKMANPAQTGVSNERAPSDAIQEPGGTAPDSIGQRAQELGRIAEEYRRAHPDATSFAASYAALLDLAQRLKKFLPRSILPDHPEASGQEHIVWTSPDHTRVYKATHPNRFGQAIGEPTPRTYFERLALANEVFGDDVRWEGLVNDAGRIRVITSQPNIVGRAASPLEAAEFLRGQGFIPGTIEGQAVWYHPDRKVLAFDTHARNFFKTQRGIVPIDVNLQRPSPEMQAALQPITERFSLQKEPDKNLPPGDPREPRLNWEAVKRLNQKFASFSTNPEFGSMVLKDDAYGQNASTTPEVLRLSERYGGNAWDRALARVRAKFGAGAEARPYALSGYPGPARFEAFQRELEAEWRKEYGAGSDPPPEPSQDTSAWEAKHERYSLRESPRPELASGRGDVKDLRRDKYLWVEAGRTVESAERLLDKYYVKDRYAKVAGPDALYVPMPSTSGRNILPQRLAQRLAKDFGGKLFNAEVATPAAIKESKHKTSYASKLNDPVEFVPIAESMASLREAAQDRRVVVLDDVLNTGESVLAMMDTLRGAGIQPAGIASIAASEIRWTSPRDMARLSERLAAASGLPLDQIQPVVENKFNGTFKQWFNYFDKSASRNPAAALEVWNAIQRNPRAATGPPASGAERHGRTLDIRVEGEEARPPVGADLTPPATSGERYSLTPDKPPVIGGDELTDTRRFARQLDATTLLSPEVKVAVTNRVYEVASMKGGLAVAQDLVKEHGAEQAARIFFDPTLQIPGMVRAKLIEAVTGELARQERAATNPAEKQRLQSAQAGFLNQALSVTTDFGQMIAGLRGFAQLTPEGAVRTAQMILQGAAERHLASYGRLLAAARKSIQEAHAAAATDALRTTDVQAGAHAAVEETVGKSKAVRAEIQAQARADIAADPETLRRAAGLGADAGKVLDVIQNHYTFNETGRNLADKLAQDAAINAEKAREFAQWLDGRFKAAAAATAATVPGKVRKARTQKGDLSTDTALDKAIQRELRATQTKLSQAVKQHQDGGLQGRIGDVIVQASGLTGPAADALRLRINARFDALAGARKAKALQNLLSDQPNTKAVRGIKQAFQKVIELTNLGGLSDANLSEPIRQKFGLKSLTPEQAAELRRLANAIQVIPPDQGFRRDAATHRLISAIEKLKPLNWWDWPMSFWYASMLSGPMTHAVNLGSTALNVMGALTATAIRHPDALPDVLNALGRGTVKGLPEMWNVLSTGHVTGLRAGNKFNDPGVFQRVEGGPGATRAQQIGSAVLLPFKLIHRALSAEDLLFFYPMAEARQALMARAIAKKEGLRRSALRARTQDLLANTEAVKSAAATQAAQEGFKGLERRRRIAEIIQQKRDAVGDFSDTARDYALQTTFNNKPYGVLGAAAQGFNNFAASHRWARLIMPFTNIVANVINESLNYTPIGAVRATTADRPGKWGGVYGNAYDAANWGQRETRGDLYAKSTLGTLLLSGLTLAALKYLDDDDPKFSITGQGPKSTSKKRTLQQTGWMPNSIKLGGRYYSYLQSPSALPLAVVGNFLDSFRYGNMDQADIWQRVAYTVPTTLKSIVQQSFLDGAARLFGAIDNPSELKSGLNQANWLFRTAGTAAIPFRAALDQINRVWDPTVYEAKDIESMALSQLPFVKRQMGLKPALNGLGEPITREVSARFTQAQKPDPVWALLARRDVGVMPSAMSWHGLELSDDQLYDVVRLSGPKIRKSLEQAMPNLLRAEEKSPHATRNAIETIVQKWHTWAKGRVMGEIQVTPAPISAAMSSFIDNHAAP